MPLFWLGRREHVRAEVCAIARVLRAGQPPCEHLISDLSSGGAFLVGRTGAPVGELVRVILHLPRQHVTTSARVVRHAGGTAPDGAAAPGFAIQFVDPSRHARDAVASEVYAALRRRAREVPRLLAVERTPERAQRLLARLGPASRSSLPATRGDEAEWLVGRWNVRVGVLGYTERRRTPPAFPALAAHHPRVAWRLLGPGGVLVGLDEVPAEAPIAAPPEDGIAIEDATAAAADGE